MTTSRSFRATLPWISEEELERLQDWCAEYCASGVAFRDEDVTIWLVMKERPRSREAFLRSARGTLKRLNINISGLRGSWLSLIDSCFVRSEADRRRHTPDANVAEPCPDGNDMSGDKVVMLNTDPRRSCSARADVFVRKEDFDVNLQSLHVCVPSCEDSGNWR